MLRSGSRSDETEEEVSRTTESELRRLVTEAVHDALDERGDSRQPNDESGGGRRVLPLLVLVGAGVGIAYLLRNRPDSVESAFDSAAGRVRHSSDEAGDWAEDAGEETADAVRTGSHHAAEAGETAADRIDERSEEVGAEFEERGEETADALEDSGEETADALADDS